jgi:fatty-acyl-CoA synthase
MAKFEELYDSLIDILFESKDPQKEFIHFMGPKQIETSLSHNDILSMSKEKALKLMTVANNEPVLIEGSNSVEFLTNFFGVMMSGNIPVPVTTNLWINDERYKEIIKSIKETTEANILLGGSSIKGLIEDLDLLLISKDNWSSLQKREKPLYRPKPNDIAFIQFSSGSTGNPKGVVLRHKHVLANLRQITNEIHNDELGNNVITWLPVHHDMGLIGGILVPYINQYEVFVMTPYEFAVNPNKWLKVISNNSGNIVVAPNSGYHMATKRVRSKVLEKLDLSCVRIALCGAEPINYKTLENFYHTFKSTGFKREAFVPCYGMAENTLAISFHRNTEAFKVDSISKDAMLKEQRAINNIQGQDKLHFVSCGKPLDDIQVRILDDNGNELGERQLGNIVIKSPSTTDGYYKREDINKDLFIDGFLKTGDLGYMVDGELYITGRKKDLIIVNGLNINAEELESYATTIKEVRAGRLAAFARKDSNTDSEKVHLVIETRKDLKYFKEAERNKLRIKISKEISSFIPVKEDQITIVAPGTIQKTTSGKVQRSKMRDLYEKGRIEKQNFPMAYFVGRFREMQIKSKIIGVSMISNVRSSVSPRVKKVK